MLLPAEGEVRSVTSTPQQKYITFPSLCSVSPTIVLEFVEVLEDMLVLLEVEELRAKEELGKEVSWKRSQ